MNRTEYEAEMLGRMEKRLLEKLAKKPEATIKYSEVHYVDRDYNHIEAKEIHMLGGKWFIVVEGGNSRKVIGRMEFAGTAKKVACQKARITIKVRLNEPLSPIISPWSSQSEKYRILQEKEVKLT